MQSDKDVQDTDLQADLERRADARRESLRERELALKANTEWREQNTKVKAFFGIVGVTAAAVCFGMPAWLAGIISVAAFIWLAR